MCLILRIYEPFPEALQKIPLGSHWWELGNVSIPKPITGKGIRITTISWGGGCSPVNCNDQYSDPGQLLSRLCSDIRPKSNQLPEKAMAPHSGTLAWRVPGMGKPGGLPSMGSHRVGHAWSDLAAGTCKSLKFLFSNIWTKGHRA